jgi:hypothetical protein
MRTAVSSNFINSVLEKSAIDYQDERVQQFVEIRKDINKADVDELWEMAIELDAINYTFHSLMQQNKFAAENNSIKELTEIERNLTSRLKSIN